MLNQQVFNNPVAMPYIDELKKIRTSLQAYILLPEDVLDELTDEQTNHIESLLDRGNYVADVLEGIDEALAAQPATKAEAQPIDPNSTLALLNETAKHLSGRDVLVSIQQPANPRALGETYIEAGALKINISPRAVADSNLYIKAFLHEVAHAKHHVTAAGMKAYAGPEAEEKLEMQATRQGNYWQNFATTHTDPTRDWGGNNYSSNLFRGQLITLLRSHAAADHIAE